MANPISYNDFVTAVQNAYSGGSSLTWSEVSASLARGGCTTDNYLQYLESFPNAVDVVKNADGTIRAARINPYASIYNSASWDAASAAGSYNSNLVPATSGGSTSLVSVPGNAVTQAGSTSLSFTQGLAQAGNFVMKEVLPAVAAAGVGIKLGKAIDGTIYNIGNALGLHPPESLNPETWNSITSGDDSLAARVFNMVFDIKPDGTTQAYIDENAFAYLSMYLNNELGIISTQNLEHSSVLDVSPLYQPIRSSSILKIVGYRDGRLVLDDTITTYGYTKGLVFEWTNGKVYWLFASNNREDLVKVHQSYTYYNYNTGAVTSHNEQDGTWGSIISKVIDNKTVYYKSFPSAYSVAADYYNTSLGYPQYEYVSPEAIANIAWTMIYGTPVGNNTEGISNQPDAVLPNTGDWTSPQDTLDSLRRQYPELFQDAVTNDVVQPDGTVTTYRYIPIPMPEQDGSTGSQTQIDTSINPDTSTQTLIDFITQILTSTDPQTQTDPTTPTDAPPNTPDTGDGDTPIVPPITGSASSLWKIYNPSQGQIDAFGAWLWSSDFIDQLKILCEHQ